MNSNRTRTTTVAGVFLSSCRDVQFDPVKTDVQIGDRREIRNERTDARGGEMTRYRRNERIYSATQSHHATVATRLKFVAGR
ncbi:hypothetical protein ALC53_00678 [Atta colombica]|uniref:Uncharacterized protein n=1 Tax=Atta colombica TaxID=520822 RepID=A0A195BXS1_9HYME|nr:hypothetical protein ALC53_00678 [Atta colombica]